MIPLRPLRWWFRTRERFHDWMWSGGRRPGLTRRAARLLPLHFSDPYAMSPKKFDKAMEDGSTVIFAGSPWIKVDVASPNTTTTATSETFVWRTNVNWDKPGEQS